MELRGWLGLRGCIIFLYYNACNSANLSVPKSKEKFLKSFCPLLSNRHQLTICAVPFMLLVTIKMNTRKEAFSNSWTLRCKTASTRTFSMKKIAANSTSNSSQCRIHRFCCLLLEYLLLLQSKTFYVTGNPW